MKFLVIFVILAGCGKIEVETNPVEVKTDIPESIVFGPDFQKASEFCDNRYGKDTKESEECFLDYRNFLSPKIEFDFASINTFCKGRYLTEAEIAGCEADLLSILKNASK